jgi:predicted transcriptional regulator
MTKTKIREITIKEEEGAFDFFTKLGVTKKEYDFEGISALRSLLSNEKARILHTIKYQKPVSIYDLAKKLGRTFKSVSDDLKLLERFGFIEFVEERTKKRKKHRPELVIDTLTINFKI